MYISVPCYDVALGMAILLERVKIQVGIRSYGWQFIEYMFVWLEIYKDPMLCFLHLIYELVGGG